MNLQRLSVTAIRCQQRSLLSNRPDIGSRFNAYPELNTNPWLTWPYKPRLRIILACPFHPENDYLSVVYGNSKVPGESTLLRIAWIPWVTNEMRHAWCDRPWRVIQCNPPRYACALWYGLWFCHFWVVCTCCSRCWCATWKLKRSLLVWESRQMIPW